MILTGATICRLGIITPHVPKGSIYGMSYGEGLAGYDIRLGQGIKIRPGRTVLGVSMEHFTMPLDVLGEVCDKSTLIRQGLRVGNSVIEPGWRGYLTLELVWNPVYEGSWWRCMLGRIRDWWTPRILVILAGTPIAQVIFKRIEAQTFGYDGKYQDQPAEPVPAILDVAQ